MNSRVERAEKATLHSPTPDSCVLTPAAGSHKNLSALAFARPADFPMGRRRPQGAVTRTLRLCVKTFHLLVRLDIC